MMSDIFEVPGTPDSSHYLNIDVPAGRSHGADGNDNDDGTPDSASRGGHRLSKKGRLTVDTS